MKTSAMTLFWRFSRYSEHWGPMVKFHLDRFLAND
jgi:hypothetical protein